MVELLLSSRSSTLINLPCLEFGGGGFFLAAIVPVKSVPITLLSSSGSDISCDVLGESACTSCAGSNIECFEIEEVSVLLLLSPMPNTVCAGGAAGGELLPRPEFPVINILLNASTSIGTFPVPVDCAVVEVNSSRPPPSKVSSVLANGFAGACDAFLYSPSPSRTGNFVSKESSS